MGERVFLEERVRRKAGITPHPATIPSPSPPSIICAWSELRHSAQNNTVTIHLLPSLHLLFTSQKSIHISDPHAILLISLLSLPLLPHGSHPLLLRLLYVWTRKSSTPSIPILSSALDAISPIFSPPFSALKTPFLISEGLLLLGSFSCVPNLSEESKKACFDLICRFLEDDSEFLVSSDTHLPEVLAGIGYALSSSDKPHFFIILRDLLALFHGKHKDLVSISTGMMILHLFEWVLSGFPTFEKIQVFIEALLVAHESPFSMIMASAGALMASRKAYWGVFPTQIVSRLRDVAEERIELVACDLISEKDDPSNVLLQCLSLALARIGMVSSRPSFLFCLARMLLTQVFPLMRFHSAVLDKSVGVAPLEVKEHLNSTVFKDAGAITSVFCKVYVGVDEENKNKVEDLIWGFCRDVYCGHRKAVMALRKGHVGLHKDLEKIAESAFLMVIFFVFAVTKQRLTSNPNNQIHSGVSVSVLIALSCIEYFRRVRLPEYLDVIRTVVVCIRGNADSAISFVNSMPSYVSLTDKSGDMVNYLWSEDDVQTARISFYIRVIPTLIESISASIFREMIASTMLLYMGHPNVKVSQGSHALFVAFMSSERGSSDNAKTLLKEHLLLYYLKRSLEGFPGVTPFQGLASGVVASVLHLPAGCPSLFYCIHSLVKKADELCREVYDWKNERGEPPPPWRNILDLVIRLVELVDIQVLPFLMKHLEHLTTNLPRDGLELVISQLHSLVAESCDVTRKPLLLPWLQSLSYASSHPNKMDLHSSHRRMNKAGPKNCIAPRL